MQINIFNAFPFIVKILIFRFNTDSQDGDGVQVNAPLVFWSVGEKENCPVTARIILSSTTLEISN